MDKKIKVVLYGILLILGWVVIQQLFKNIPFSKEDLTLNYYIAKAIIESIYVIFSIKIIISYVLELIERK